MTTFAGRHPTTLRRIGLILVFAAAILGTTRLTLEFGAIANAPTAAFSFLILVLLSAFFGDLPVAVAASVIATLCFNYFYLPPIGTFHIEAFSDWISLAAFLLTALTISGLTSSAASHAARAHALDRTLSQMKMTWTFGTCTSTRERHPWPCWPSGARRCPPAPSKPWPT
jgi:K+-sensing histidine kinase KdpD